MSKKETDILLIRKYLNGELDARAMHQLEKRALDDPFLMDALEGYENSGSDQQPQLNDLSSRLHQRVTKKERRIIPYRILAIAASVLIVFTIGVLWLNNSRKQTPQTTTRIVEPIAKPTPASPAATDTSIDNQIAANVPPSNAKRAKKTLRTSAKSETVAAANIVQADKFVAADLAVVKPDTASEDTTPLNEMVVMDYSSQKKKKDTQSAPIAEATKLREVPVTSTEKALQSAVAGVTNTPAVSPFSAPSSAKIILQGRIIDKTDGMALPGVSVRVSGTKFGALTDNNGKFSIPVDSNKSNNIVIAYIGYNTLKVNTHNRDSLKTIGLEPNSKSLNEVVVVGYGSQKKDDETIVAAHPREGWHSFKKYLNENNKSPDGAAGVVKLSFMVDNNGEISEVTVVKGLSPATNKKAIDLVNNGPQWVGNTSGKTEQVNIRIKFVAEK